MDEADARCADHAEQKYREPRQRIAGARENPDVGPGIEIVLHRQEKDLRCSAAFPKLGAIGVFFPTHAAQQFPIGGTKRDEIATAAMIGAEHERVRRELRESALDIFRAKARTIAADRDYFVIAELRDPLDRVLKARREIPARLSMHLATGNGRITSRSEKMDINPQRNFRSKRGEIEERPSGDGERTSRQFDMRFVGEDENSSSGHAFGYEKARGRDKPFSL